MRTRTLLDTIETIAAFFFLKGLLCMGCGVLVPTAAQNFGVYGYIKFSVLECVVISEL